MQYVTTVTDTEHILKPLPEFVTEVMLENTKLREHDANAIRKGDEIRNLLKLEPTAKFAEALRTIKQMQDKVELQKRALKDCADREHNDGKTIDRMQASLLNHDDEVLSIKTHYGAQLTAKDAVIFDQQKRLDNQKAAIDAYQQEIKNADANLEILHNANDSLNKELVKTRALLFEANARLVFPAIKIETVQMDSIEVQERVANYENRIDSLKRLRVQLIAERNQLLSDRSVRDKLIAELRELVEQANSGYVAYKEIHLEDQAKNEALVKHANDLEEELTKVKDELAGLKWTINNRNREYYEVRGERDLARMQIKALQEDLAKLENDSKMARAVVQQSMKKLEKFRVFATSLASES